MRQQRKPHRSGDGYTRAWMRNARLWGLFACCWLLAGGCASPLHVAGTEYLAAVQVFGEGEPADTPPLGTEEEPPSLPVATWATSVQELESAETHEAMTLDQVLRYALDHHPLLRARQHEVEVARARLIAAGLFDNPQLVMDTETPVHESGSTELTTRITFTVPTGGRRRLARAAACAGIRRARCTLQQQTETLLLEVADVATEVLYLQELADLQAHLSKLAAEGAKLQSSRFDAGAITFADKIESEIDSVDAELSRLDVLSQLKTARLRLCRAIGMSPPRPIRLEGRLAFEPVADVPLDTILEEAKRVEPALAQARAAVSESRSALALAYAAGKPDIEMGPRYQDRLGEANDDIGARFRVNLPLFNRNQDGICQNAAQLRVNRAMYEVAELTTLADVAEAYTELMQLQARLEYYETYVAPLLERTDSEILQDLGSEVIGANQVSDVLQEFVQMRRRHLELRYRHSQLRTRLELFLNCRIDDLQENAHGLVEEEEGFDEFPLSEAPAVQPDIEPEPSLAPVP